MTSPDHRPSAGTEGAWATGIFAGSMLVMIGIFQAIEGLAAIINDDFFVVPGNYTFNLDTTGWGWIHLILGIVVFLVGLAVFATRSWALILGMGIAILSAIANFFFIPYYPFWSILVIAIDVFIVWSLARVYSDERRRV
jgi:hypothetical protein